MNCIPCSLFAMCSSLELNDLCATLVVSVKKCDLPPDLVVELLVLIDRGGNLESSKQYCNAPIDWNHMPLPLSAPLH